MFWGPEAQTTSIKKLGDVLTVYLDWKPSSAREVWKLDEEITLGKWHWPRTFGNTNDYAVLIYGI